MSKEENNSVYKLLEDRRKSLLNYVTEFRKGLVAARDALKGNDSENARSLVFDNQENLSGILSLTGIVSSAKILRMKYDELMNFFTILDYKAPSKSIAPETMRKLENQRTRSLERGNRQQRKVAKNINLELVKESPKIMREGLEVVKELRKEMSNAALGKIREIESILDSVVQEHGEKNNIVPLYKFTLRNALIIAFVSALFSFIGALLGHLL